MLGLIMRLVPLGVAGVAVGGGGGDIKELAQRATDAVLQLKSSMEVRGIVKSIRLDMVHGETPPTDLQAYIEANIDSQGTDPTLDAWGTAYELAKEGGALFVVSCGPDESCGTDDDIRGIVHDEKGRFRSRRGRRR